MSSNHVESEWKVEWAAPAPHGDEYLDKLMLSREQAIEYGDELVWALRVDGDMLRERGLDPKEPFAWKIEDGELSTKQITRQAFEEVAESDRKDSYYAETILRYRAERRIRQS